MPIIRKAMLTAAKVFKDVKAEGGGALSAQFGSEDAMKFGASTVTRGVFTTPEAYCAVARAAERAGFDFLSVSDHLVVPANVKSRYPYDVAGSFSAAERSASPASTASAPG